MFFQNLAQLSNNQEVLDTLFEQKTKWSDLLGLKAQGALVRSFSQSVNELDSPSKYFFNLEKRNWQKLIIHTLKSETGDLLSDPAEIWKRASSFYAKLYTCEYKEDKATKQYTQFLNRLPKISDKSKEMLSGVITLDELQKALQSLQTGKSPGLDGFPMDFFISVFVLTWGRICLRWSMTV